MIDIKRDKFIKASLAGIFSAFTIGILTLITYKTELGLFLAASFGSSMVLLYGYPESPFAQPKNIFFGHLITALTGVIFVNFIHLPIFMIIPIAVGFGIFLMIIFFRLLLVIIFYHICLFAHCQIPCGIYSDAMQIRQIQEDLTTIEKAMRMINNLSEKSDPQTLNQIGRWISTKEQHAQSIQNTISQYFLTQRIKQSSKNYENQLITLHQLLVSIMKCKQNVSHGISRNSN